MVYEYERHGVELGILPCQVLRGEVEVLDLEFEDMSMEPRTILEHPCKPLSISSISLIMELFPKHSSLAVRFIHNCKGYRSLRVTIFNLVVFNLSF